MKVANVGIVIAFIGAVVAYGCISFGHPLMGLSLQMASTFAAMLAYFKRG